MSNRSEHTVQDINIRKINFDILYLIIASIIVTILQIYFILNFPDSDFDSYAHHIISRDLLRYPFNLSMHWVWLPLYHYYGSLFVLAGMGVNEIRLLNVFIWNVIPFLIYYFLKNKSEEKIIYFSGAFFSLLFPLGILMGTSAQPEPLFMLFLIMFIIYFDKERYIPSAIFLLLLVTLRYEGWAIFSVLTIYILLNLKTNIRNILWVIILPLGFILYWIIARAYFDGEWVKFLKGTSDFAVEYIGQNAGKEISIGIISKIFLYPVIIPSLFIGVLLLLLPFGIKNFYKNNKIFFISSLSILFFITLSRALDSNLGLNRHFTALIPFYSVGIGYGINFLYNRIKYKKSFIILSIFILLFYDMLWFKNWTERNNVYLKEYIESANELREINPEVIISNEPAVEILSRLNYVQFYHYWINENEESKISLENFLKNHPETFIIISEKNMKYLDNRYEVFYKSSINDITGNRIFFVKKVR